jgi:hypothetical protein
MLRSLFLLITIGAAVFNLKPFNSSGIVKMFATNDKNRTGEAIRDKKYTLVEQK